MHVLRDRYRNRPATQEEDLAKEFFQGVIE